MIASDPVAAAQFYQIVVETVLRVLLKCGEPVMRDTKKTDMRQLDAQGIFGNVRAYLGTTEETGRAALHLHLIVHTDGLTPEVVTKCVYNPVCYAKMVALVNSQVQAWLPPEAADWSSIRPGARSALSAPSPDSDDDGDGDGGDVEGNRPVQATTIPLPPLHPEQPVPLGQPWHQPPENDDGGCHAAFVDGVYRCVRASQYHCGHGPSCWKTGSNICRYAMPQRCSDKCTAILQLDTECYPTKAFTNLHLREWDNSCFPFPFVDTQSVHVLELHRPGLPAESTADPAPQPATCSVAPAKPPASEGSAMRPKPSTGRVRFLYSVYF